MGSFLVYVFGGILAVMAAFYALWIIFAVLARIVSFMIFYWLISFSVALVPGLLVGVRIPWRVLRGHGRAPFRQITPSDVVAGGVIPGKLRGETHHFGWDKAWPLYIPYQAKEDAKGVITETRATTVEWWGYLGRRFTPYSNTGTGVRSVAVSSVKQGPNVLWTGLLLAPLAGAITGLWLSVGSWLLAMLVLGIFVWSGQKAALVGMRWIDVLSRRKAKASLKCPVCYEESDFPSYRCSNPECSIVHRTMLPGPLGLLTRRCECGTQLPNTIRSAAKRLETVCPYCNNDLPTGSGSRHTIQIPVIGSTGAGKTRLLTAATAQLENRLGELGGSLVPLTSEAHEYAVKSRELMSRHADTAKTAQGMPRGVPFVMKDKEGNHVELQLMDVAGEAFNSWDSTADLRYLDGAQALLYVFDPLASPPIARELRLRSGQSVVVTSEDQEAAYGAAIDRMRAEGVALKSRALGVVMSKADVLLSLPSGHRLPGYDSDSIRNWLMEQDLELFVGRFEKDFRDVRYFLVDSMGERDYNDPLSPAATLGWVLSSCKSAVTLDDPPQAVLVAPAAQPEPNGP